MLEIICLSWDIPAEFPSLLFLGSNARDLTKLWEKQLEMSNYTVPLQGSNILKRLLLISACSDEITVPLWVTFLKEFGRASLKSRIL